MDTHTLEILEFEKVRALVASYAACSLGKEGALRIEPGREIGAIAHQQALTTEMAEALASGLAPPFGGLRDVRPQVRRAKVGAMLEAEELAEAVSVLRSVAELDAWLDRIGDEFPRLGALREGVGEFSGVANAIEGCLDARANVLDTASRRLSAIRREVGQVEQRIQETLRHLLRAPEIRRILRYPNFTMVGHHYVLPIAKDHRGEIEGSVHRTSASNETVYVEPRAIAEQSAQLSYLRSKEQKEVRRILRWLSAQVGQVADSLLTTLETLGTLDLIHARGRYSLDYRMSPPDLNTEGKVALRGARHPLLEHLFREDRPEPPAAPRAVVPIDVHLGFQFNLLVITGPNTGGKTVALKTVGLLAVMAQAGLHVPANPGSQLPVFDEVLADIGDEQSLEQSLSTFSSHIRRVSQILTTATDRSLVLLDEMGAGTDPAEGAALGRAILDELDSLGCRALVTTHIGDLKTYAFTNPRAQNAAVEFDVETLRPRYHLRIGDIGQSNALQIARRLELPEHLVARAGRYLDERQAGSRPDWEVAQKMRQEAEAARREALEAQAEAERTRDALSQRLADLQRQAEGDARVAEARARLQPGDRVVVPRFGYDRPGRVVKLDPRKGVAVVAIGQMKWDVPVAELIPQLVRNPDVPAPARTSSSKPGPRLEDFGDE
ncbi:MAG TPA: DNA strand exchange inhibitor protein [Isosphaeraceae bacterium]|jgi:DNA mismatch repair protein MutS2|nr:DNA strand exchange inhibitor protein [Isosphaeraceae bacterium]